MLNHLVAWKGWIFRPDVKQGEAGGPTRSEFATYDRMVLNKGVAPSAAKAQTANAVKH